MNTSRFSAARIMTTIAACALLTAVPPALRAQDVAYSDPQATPQADPPSRVARISVMQGNVSFQPATVNDFSAAEANYPLTSGDRLYTDNGALAELEIGNLVARLGQQADFTITSLTDQVAQFGLAQGSVVLKTFQLDPDTTTEIDTPNASITVLASGVVRVDYFPDQNVTVVRELSGQIQVDADGVHQVLEGNTQVLRVTGSNPSTWDSENLPRPDDLDRFSGQRDSYDRQATASESAYVPPDMIGAEDLASNGDWESTGDYGAVWYPNNVADDWAPYSVGRWVSIAPWGWTWVGGERWGFAPYHYGRWIHVGRRWGWVPGPPTAHPMYSPALVAFVGGAGFSVGGAGVTAWFPLGPGEQYRPWYRTSGAYVNRVNAGGFHNNHVNNFPGGYMNRSAVTAIPVRNFGNGRPVRESVVHVDPNQLRSASVGGRPPVEPPQRQIVGNQPARALPPLRARPVLPTRAGENAGGNRNGYSNGPRNNNSPAEITRPGNNTQRPTGTPGQPARNTYDRQPQPGTSNQPARGPYDRQPQPGTQTQPVNPTQPARGPYDRQPQPSTQTQPVNPTQPARGPYDRQPPPSTQTQPVNPTQPARGPYDRQPQPGTQTQPVNPTQPVRGPYDRQPQPGTQTQPVNPTQPARDTYERPQRQLTPTVASPTPQTAPVERPNPGQQRPDFQRQDQPQRPDVQRQQPQPQTQPQRSEPQRNETRPVEPQRQPTPQPQAAPPQHTAPPSPPPSQPRPQAAPPQPHPQPQPTHVEDKKKQ